METFDNVLAEEHLKSLISALLTVLHFFFFSPLEVRSVQKCLRKEKKDDVFPEISSL